MAFYSVLGVTPTNEDWTPDYISNVGDLMAKHGGIYLARTANHQCLEGEETEPALRIIIQWPNEQATKDFMSDSDYAPYLQARTEGSISHHFLVEGKDDLA